MMYDEKHLFINGESYRASGRDATLMRRFADQRRRHFAQVVRAAPPDAETEQGEHEHETGERQQARVHACASACLRGVCVSCGRDTVSGNRRKRLSVAAMKPPSIMSSAPSQIQRTNGFT